MVETVSVYASQFEEFLNSKYRVHLEKIADQYPLERSLNISYDSLQEFNPDLADELIEKPHTIIQAAKDAIKKMALITTHGTEFSPNIRLYGLPADHTLLIRNINSEFINKFIGLNGIVTKITEVKPKIFMAVFECMHCGRVYNVPQTEKSAKLIEPGICSCERKRYQLLVEQSSFVDTQKMEIQEPLELLRGGEEAKKINVWLEDDLTNKIIPGDKIEGTGVLRLKEPKQKGAVYDKLIESNHILKVEKEFEDIDLTEEQEEQIKELSNDPQVYEKIISSIAPSIYGHTEIKEAIVLQLFGGTTHKVKPDGMRIRPDIHMLLIGDPGTAKTRLLQYIDLLAPKGYYVSGKSSSAAGLTATAEKDDFAEGGWTLKAGALVLAAGGMAMIDEFDKISDQDKAALHETMESQEIHIAKAGIIATFKANTAILAAANPKYGRFDAFTPIADQFEISPTLLSRFDLIFPMRDVLDEKKDSELAAHVLIAHQTSGMRAAKQTLKQEHIEDEKRILPIIKTEFLRNYIGYSRKNIHPTLTDEAMEKLKEFYLSLRKLSEAQGAIAITPRQLEAVVRLAESSAKVRLSQTVDLEDAERAIKLSRFCMKEVGMDAETGRMDIDLITTGAPKSKMDKVRSLFMLIKRLDKQYDEVEHEALLEEAKAQGIKPEEFEKLLEMLKTKGDIYSPKYGVYKPAEQK